MGLGPSLSIRQSQQLVLTPQLTQAIKLLQLSNLELDAFIAEELSKNPLLESRSDEEAGEQPAGESGGDEAGGYEAADDPGADDLILGTAEDDRPLDVDWTSEALEIDSYADVVTSSASDEAFDFDRVQYSASSLAEHLLDQFGEEGERGVLTLSVIDGRLALDGVVVEDDRPQGFKAPERPPIGFALAPAGGTSPGSAAVH